MKTTVSGLKKWVTLVPVAVVFVLTAAGISALGAANTVTLRNQASKYYFGKGVEQDFNRALSLYLQAARAGDPEAQYIAGGMYFRGLGTPVDYNKALEWIYKAARNGKSTVESQKILGQSFLLGRGVPKNYAEARRWYREAAKHGDPEALNELGYMYFVGNGVVPDPNKAFDYFMQSAKRGSNLAQYNVGIMLYIGTSDAGTDLVGAYSWLSLAASEGNIQARQVLQTVENSLSREELNEAQVKARKLYEEFEVPLEGAR